MADSGTFAGYEAHMFPGKAYLRCEKSASDLSLLNSHRLSHVAETGQLAPRDRRHIVKSPSINTVSSDGAGSAKSGCPSYNAAQASPEASDMVYDRPSSDFPDASKPISHADTEKLTDVKQSDVDICSSPKGVSDMGATHTKAQVNDEPTSNIKNDKASTNARKVNSGFEILAHGTFAKPQAKDNNSTEKEKKQHQKQRQKKIRANLNMKLLNKLRKGKTDESS